MQFVAQMRREENRAINTNKTLERMAQLSDLLLLVKLL